MSRNIDANSLLKINDNNFHLSTTLLKFECEESDLVPQTKEILKIIHALSDDVEKVEWTIFAFIRQCKMRKIKWQTDEIYAVEVQKYASNEVRRSFIFIRRNQGMNKQRQSKQKATPAATDFLLHFFERA